MPADQPLRTCVGCRRIRPQAELVRLYIDTNNNLLLGRTGHGRGAWLCLQTPGPCLSTAVDRKALTRAFRRSPNHRSISDLCEGWPFINQQ